jgi:hypothetical protein
MSLFNKTKPASLTEWLEIATDGLATSGRERIAREIEAHYAAAVESHLSHGEPEPDAQANALDELGAPKKARRSFRKRHLTVLEEKRILNLQKRTNSKFWLAYFVLMGCFFSFTKPASHPDTLVYHYFYGFLYTLATTLGWIGYPGSMFMISRKPETKLQVSTLLLYESFRLPLASVPVSWYLGWRSLPLMGWMLMLFGIAFGIRDFQIWLKIRKNGNPAVGGESGLA